MNNISIITATYNSENKIKTLIKSLNQQTDQNFDWIIVDNESSDRTVKIINHEVKVNFKLIVEKDKGIYDALNKGVAASSTNYYLVLGSDDILYPESIQNFNSIINNNKSNNLDFVFASWVVNGKIKYPKKNLGFIYGMLGVGSCHSVATLIKKNLHIKYGKYDLNFPVCADQLFVKRAVYGGSILYYDKFVSGIFSTEGYSSQNTFKNLSEFFKIQIMTENLKIIQIILYVLRLFKNYNKL